MQSNLFLKFCGLILSLTKENISLETFDLRVSDGCNGNSQKLRRYGNRKSNELKIICAQEYVHNEWLFFGNVDSFECCLESHKLRMWNEMCWPEHKGPPVCMNQKRIFRKPLRIASHHFQYFNGIQHFAWPWISLKVFHTQCSVCCAHFACTSQ